MRSPMTPIRTDTLPIGSADDIVRVRQEVRRRAVEVGLRLIDQTKIVTAASELARNTWHYGGGGACEIQSLANGGRKGLRLIFTDQGPGIADLGKAMADGYSSGTGMGLGLSGARRLSNEFDIDSAPGKGTRVAITRWT